MLKRILGTVLLVASLFVVVPMNSAQAVGCVGSSCNGKDPEAQGCSADATTVSSFVAHYHNNFGLDPYLELRESKACKARWVRVKSGMSDWGCGGGSTTQMRIQNIVSAGVQQLIYVKTFSPCGPFPKWTPMVGKTSLSISTKYGFREGTHAWCSDSYYNPCKTTAW